MKAFWTATVVVALVMLVVLKARSSGRKPTSAAAIQASGTNTAAAVPSSSPASQASRLIAKAAAPAPLLPQPGIAGQSLPSLQAQTVGGPLTQIMFQQLEGIMTVSDVIHDNPGLDDEALVQVAMQRTSLPKEALMSILAEYPTSTAGSLDAHYRRALANPELKAVADAFTQAGVPSDLGSTLLADAFRLCSLRTQFGEFLSSTWEDLRKVPDGVDQASELLDEAARIADERSDALVAIEATFKERFIARHGMEPATVQALLGALWPLRVTTATAEELHPPRLVQR